MYVTNQDDSTVSIIETVNHAVIDTIDVGDSPEGIDITPDGNLVYVVNWSDGTVSIIDTNTHQVNNTIKVGKGSRAFGQFISHAK